MDLLTIVTGYRLMNGAETMDNPNPWGKQQLNKIRPSFIM